MLNHFFNPSVRLKRSAILPPQHLVTVLATLTACSGLISNLDLRTALAIEPAKSEASLAPDPAPPASQALQVPNANVTIESPGASPSNGLIDRTSYDTGATALETPVNLANDRVNVVIESREQKPGFDPIAPSERTVPQLNLGDGIGSLQISSNQGISWAPSEQSIVPALPSYLNQKLLRPFSRIGLQNVKFTYPLAIPSPISSLFGWRIHPLSGNTKMHTGTDIAAPEGTPVLAAMAGKVLLADTLGGYGLTIALEHSDGTQQTLYGHLSEIFVKPGERIQQGAVIGRVGSTGNSTGPHLHLEFRQLTDAGWMAVDPGTQLENSMNDLTQALKNTPKPQTLTLKPTFPDFTQPSPSLQIQLPSLSIPLVATPATPNSKTVKKTIGQ
jgi:murein DD-endopeptidase MepM/ murein hydrolase activator NlpD